MTETLISWPSASTPPSGGARVSSGKDSKQDYQTPDDFLRAITARFGHIAIDLAATAQNAKAPIFITEETNSLKQPWAEMLYEYDANGICFLNPPFKQISPWAEKCAAEAARGCPIAFLTTASVDTIWWARFIHEKAHVLFLAPRLKFIGANDPFMKPLTLSCFNLGLTKWYEPWKWKT